jgi:dihydrofolate synthase/folylpolyglutamate synthase
MQAVNAAVAISAAEALNEQGIPVTIEETGSGIAATRWPGRLEAVADRPLLLVDGAHNGASARELAVALTEYYAPTRRVFILGTSSDKDVTAIVAGLRSASDTFVVTRSRHPRAASLEVVAAAVRAAGGVAVAEPDVERAIATARQLAGESGLVCATGSLFVVAAVREAMGLGAPD